MGVILIGSSYLNELHYIEWTPLCPNNHGLFIEISRQVGQVAGIVKLDCEAGEWFKNTIVLLSIWGEFFLWKEA